METRIYSKTEKREEEGSALGKVNLSTQDGKIASIFVSIVRGKTIEIILDKVEATYDQGKILGRDGPKILKGAIFGDEVWIMLCGNRWIKIHGFHSLCSEVVSWCVTKQGMRGHFPAFF